MPDWVWASECPDVKTRSLIGCLIYLYPYGNSGRQKVNRDTVIELYHGEEQRPNNESDDGKKLQSLWDVALLTSQQSIWLDRSMAAFLDFFPRWLPRSCKPESPASTRRKWFIDRHTCRRRLPRGVLLISASANIRRCAGDEEKRINLQQWGQYWAEASWA